MPAMSGFEELRPSTKGRPMQTGRTSSPITLCNLATVFVHWSSTRSA